MSICLKATQTFVLKTFKKKDDEKSSFDKFLSIENDVMKNPHIKSIKAEQESCIQWSEKMG